MRKKRIRLPIVLSILCLLWLSAAVPSGAAETYRVKRGDTLRKIAKKFHVGVDALKAANRLEGDSLRANEVLTIPSKGRAKARAGARAVSKQETRDGAGETAYRVQKGDTLAGISRKTGVPVSQIREMNPMHSKRLRAGSRLVLPGPAPEAKNPVEPDDDPLEEDGEIVAGIGEGWNPPPSEALPSRWRGPAERELFVRVVRSYDGVPYRLGGNSLRGIDCSAFTRKVYGIFDVELPRTAREQMSAGKRVGRDELDIGDLVFFKTRRTRVHVGIFLGGGQFFHLSSRNRAGKVDDIDSAYFKTRFFAGVRLKERPISGVPAVGGAPPLPDPKQTVPLAARENGALPVSP